MQQFYSQRQEMEIPQENLFMERSIMHKNDENLIKFLKKNFKFPSTNLNEINEFISLDTELMKIIYDLPKLITSKLKYNWVSLDFMKETDINEKILEIIIYSPLEDEILLQKEDLISDEIIDKYPKAKKEYLILVEPYEE